MHSYKFIAALQDKSTSANPILLMTERNSGHIGNTIKAEAAIYAFIYEQLGIPPVSLP